MVFTIYCLTNTVNGKQYIGQTNNLVRRLSRHKSAWSGCTYLYSAIKKYGWDSFSVSVLAYATSANDINLLEIQYIRELDTLSPKGYNLTGGGQIRGILAPETQKRISEAAKKRGMPQACRDASHTPEVQAKRTATNRIIFADPAKRKVYSKRMKEILADPENLKAHSARSKKVWADPQRRKAQSKRMKEIWAERKVACSR